MSDEMDFNAAYLTGTFKESIVVECRTEQQLQVGGCCLFKSSKSLTASSASVSSFLVTGGLL